MLKWLYHDKEGERHGLEEGGLEEGWLLVLSRFLFKWAYHLFNPIRTVLFLLLVTGVGGWGGGGGL